MRQRRRAAMRLSFFETLWPIWFAVRMHSTHSSPFFEGICFAQLARATLRRFWLICFWVSGNTGTAGASAATVTHCEPRTEPDAVAFTRNLPALGKVIENAPSEPAVAV